MVDGQELILAYDLLDQGFDEWISIVGGVTFIIVVALYLRHPAIGERGLYPFFDHTLEKGAAWVVLLVSIAVTAAFFVHLIKYWSLTLDYEAGRYKTVEGHVRDLEVTPPTSQTREEFLVKGVRFEYSVKRVTSGFNQPFRYGGPIREGLYVRIKYIDDVIVRLEVESLPRRYPYNRDP